MQSLPVNGNFDDYAIVISM